MSAAAGLDIRVPIGALFTLLGLLVGGYGLVTRGDAVMYARSGGENINLWWGLVMLVFGLLMLVASRRGRRTLRPAEASVAGAETERREHVLDLERE